MPQEEDAIYLGLPKKSLVRDKSVLWCANSTVNVWLGLGKDHVLGYNKYLRFEEHCGLGLNYGEKKSMLTVCWNQETNSGLPLFATAAPHVGSNMDF